MIGGRKQITLKIGRLVLTPSDFVFIALFFAAALCFVLTAPYGLTVTDEVQYQLVCRRLMTGDKLFADNWLILGMQTMFQYLPFRLYYALRGGMEGIVLAMRYVYVGIKLVFCVYVYVRLRRYRLWAVFSALFFVGTDLFGIKTTSYYSICTNAILLVGMLLFVKEKARPADWILAGFFLSCGVLVFPPVAVIWFGYCILVAIRGIAGKRGRSLLTEYDFILSGRVWLYQLIGICASATVFLVLCVFFFTGTDWSGILTGVKSALGFVGDSPVAASGFFMSRISKIQRYVEMIGPVPLILTAVVFAAGVIARRFTIKAEKPCFLSLCFLCAAITVRLLLIPYVDLGDASGECSCHPLMIALPALMAYLYTKNRNRRLFAFFLLCLSVSLVADLFSMNSVGALFLPGCVPSVLILRDYYYEKTSDPAVGVRKKSKRQKQTAVSPVKSWRVALCVLLVLFPALEVWHYAYMARLHETERMFVRSASPLDAKIDAGVLKGVYTTREIKNNYDKSMRDVEKIKLLCRNTLFVIDYDTSVYLNADLPVAVPLLHYLTDSWHREEFWWDLHPEKRPDVVYIPFFTLSYIPYETITPQEYLAYFEENADITVTEGEIGYIVSINAWNGF